MNHNYKQLRRGAVAFGALMIGLAPPGWGFDSGSTSADGAFSPTVDTTVDLPVDGVFNFTTVTIPSGVTVRFNKNTANTPVTFLVSGDVTIDGSINISGGASSTVGAAGDGNQGDDGLPGIGGPGGFDGGRGGVPGNSIGAPGLGPGAGNQARGNNTSGTGCGGGGAGYSVTGANSSTSSSSNSPTVCDLSDKALGGNAYGVEILLPLIGGSGGGGASAGTAFGGSGGGGGGGAILIAASGTVTVNGAINANGGESGNSAGSLEGGTGGGGSGGAVRIVATTLTGNGPITANGGNRGISATTSRGYGGKGSTGRIRLEADIYTRTTPTSPNFSFAVPQDIFVAGLPNLRITSVAGVAAPASPTGDEDIVLAESTPNPVTVEFATTGVPVGNTVALTVTPSSGSAVRVVSAAITGAEAAGVTSVSVDLPDGPSVLSAEVSFTVTVAMREQFDYSRFAKGEPVERIRLSIDPALGSLTTLMTAIGNEYTWPTSVFAIN